MFSALRLYGLDEIVGLFCPIVAGAIAIRVSSTTRARISRSYRARFNLKVLSLAYLNKEGLEVIALL